MKRFLMTPKIVLALFSMSVCSGAIATINFEADSLPWTDIGIGNRFTTSDDSESTITGGELTNAGFFGNDLLAGNCSVRIGNNGGIIWGNSPTDTFNGASQVGWANSTEFLSMTESNLSTTGNGSGTRQFLAVHWDDLAPLTGQGFASIEWKVINSDLIIQWNRQDHWSAAGTGTITFQAVIRSGVNHKRVSYVYNDTLFGTDAFQNDAGSATIGFKNWGLNANGNDIEFGTGGGSGTELTTNDSALNSRPKVGGWQVTQIRSLLTRYLSFLSQLQ